MSEFKWRHFEGEIILWAVRWYCRYGISYRDLEQMMGERGVPVDHSTIYRWVQKYAPEIEKRLRWQWRRPQSTSWRVDETYVKVRGKWTYLYRALDKDGNTIDFYLSPTRNAKAAKRFLSKALNGLKDWEKPTVINTDKAPTYGIAISELKAEGKCPEGTVHRQVKYLNNVVEADHGKLKQLIRPVRGFKTMKTAYATIMGFEVMRALRKGQAASSTSLKISEARRASSNALSESGPVRSRKPSQSSVSNSNHNLLDVWERRQHLRRAACTHNICNRTEREIETDIPQRMDRLPWSGGHAKIITALGTSWLLDGLEVTLVGSLSGVLESKNGLSLTDPQVTLAATVYLAGAVCGALFFGHLTDRLGRKKLFLVTLATYSVATLCTAFSANLPMFAVCRFFTGLGIGGEYAAINSAVDELIPGKVRGTVDLFVNATFWVGATVGSIAAFVLLGGHGLPLDKSWRYPRRSNATSRCRVSHFFATKMDGSQGSPHFLI